MTNPIIAMMREDDYRHDPWGTGMSWAYAVAEVLYDADPNMVPSELQYRPSFAGPEVPTRTYADTGEPIEVSHATSEVWGWLHGEHHDEKPIYWEDPTFEARIKVLVVTGRILHRYLDWCRAAGRDY